MPKKKRRRSGPTRARSPAPVLGIRQSAESGFFDGYLGWTDPVFAIELRRKGRATEAFVALADRLNDTRFEVGTATPQVAVTEFVRATKTLRAACLLVRDGYGPQALVLARTIFESTLACGGH